MMATLKHSIERAAACGVLFVLRLYQLILSPWLGNCCRFHPSCSRYCADAVRRFGVFRGVCLGVVRVFKCHPFHHGGFDPVPDRLASLGVSRASSAAAYKGNTVK